MLKENTRAAIIKLQASYPMKRSALIPALHLAQQEAGYLPLEIQKEVAELFEISLNEVHTIVTFYDMFHEKPVGRHLVHVCKNASCMLRGSDELLDTLCSKLNISPHGTSENGEFTVIPSECLGACDRAPMMIIDDEVFGPVKPIEIDNLLEQAKGKCRSSCPIPQQEV